MRNEEYSCSLQPYPPEPRELSPTTGRPIFRMSHIVARLGPPPSVKEVTQQAMHVRDHLLDTWSDSRSTEVLWSPAGRRLSVYVLRESDDKFVDETEEGVFAGVSLCLTLDAKVVMHYDDGSFEPYESLDSEDLEFMTPRILRVLALNCR